MANCLCLDEAISFTTFNYFKVKHNVHPQGFSLSGKEARDTGLSTSKPSSQNNYQHVKKVKSLAKSTMYNS